MSRPHFTTLHPQSSHHLPVLVIDGQACGPGDIDLAELFPDVDFSEGLTAESELDQAVLTARAILDAPLKRHVPVTPAVADLFADPRQRQREHVRAWLSQHAGAIRARVGGIL